MRGHVSMRMESISRVRRSAGKRPPELRRPTRQPREDISLHLFPGLESSEPAVCGWATWEHSLTWGFLWGGFLRGTSPGKGRLGNQDRTGREAQNKDVVSVRGWLLTGPTGSSLVCPMERGPGFTSMSFGHWLILLIIPEKEGKPEGGGQGCGEAGSSPGEAASTWPRANSSKRGKRGNRGPLAVNTHSTWGWSSGKSMSNIQSVSCLSSKNFLVLLTFSPSSLFPTPSLPKRDQK